VPISPYADWDGDGIPDHVQTPQGVWQAFNPSTGDLLASNPAAPSGGNITTGSFPDSFGGGGVGRAENSNDRKPAYPLPNPAASPAPGARPAAPARDSGRQPYIPGLPSHILYGGGQIGVRPAPQRTYGGSAVNQNAYGGGGSGSGGGAVRGLISAWRSKLTSSLYPGSGSSSSGYSAYPEPPQPKMRGAAKGMNPDQAYGLYYRPSMMLPRVAPGLDPASPNYADIASLPATQLANLTKGARGGDSLSHFTNSLSDVYDRVANREQWFDQDKMAANLTYPNSRSALGQQAQLPASQQADAFLANVGAIFNTTTDPATSAAMQAYASTLADKWGARALNKQPGHGRSLAEYAGKRLFYRE
jgi:hypothetical protein